MQRLTQVGHIQLLFHTPNKTASLPIQKVQVYFTLDFQLSKKSMPFIEITNLNAIKMQHTQRKKGTETEKREPFWKMASFFICSKNHLCNFIFYPPGSDTCCIFAADHEPFNCIGCCIFSFLEKMAYMYLDLVRIQPKSCCHYHIRKRPKLFS